MAFPTTRSQASFTNHGDKQEVRPEQTPMERIDRIIVECCRGELHEDAARDHILFVLRQHPDQVSHSIDDLMFRLRADRKDAVHRNAVRGHLLNLVNTLHFMNEFTKTAYDNDTFKLSKSKTEYHFHYKPTSYHATLYRDGRDITCPKLTQEDFIEMCLDCLESLLPAEDAKK